AARPGSRGRSTSPVRGTRSPHAARLYGPMPGILQAARNRGVAPRPPTAAPRRRRRRHPGTPRGSSRAHGQARWRRSISSRTWASSSPTNLGSWKPCLITIGGPPLLCSVCVASPPKKLGLVHRRPWIDEFVGPPSGGHSTKAGTTHSTCPVAGSELAIEPGPRKRPVALGGPPADAQARGGFLDRESGEEAQLHQRRGLGIDFCQARESRIQVDQVVGRNFVVQDGLQIQGATNTAAAAFEALAVASTVNQDSPHGLGRGREKMAPAVPGSWRLLGGRWWVVAEQTKGRRREEGGWF